MDARGNGTFGKASLLHEALDKQVFLTKVHVGHGHNPGQPLGREASPALHL